MKVKKYIEELKYYIKGFEALLHPNSEAFKCESLCILLFFPSINFFLNHILQTYFKFSSISNILYLAMGFLGVISYLSLKKIPPIVLILSVIIFILSFFSYLIYPEISIIFFSDDLNPLNSAFLYLFFYSVPALILSSNIKNWDYLINRIELYAVITVILGIVDFYYFTIQALSEDVPNYMVYSYNLLSGLGALAVFSLINKGIIRIILLSIGSLCLLLIGARGAQVSFVLIFICTLFVISKNKIKLLFSISLCSIAILLFVLNIENIEIILDRNLGEYGIHSRSITKIIEGDFFSDSGRNLIREDVKSGLRNNPLGYGLFGDRYLTAVGRWGNPTYSHNIFWEFCCNFGIIIGPILLLIIALNIIRIAKDKHCPLKSICILILLPCGFFKLFFSSSYLLCIPFFAILGILFNKNRYC